MSSPGESSSAPRNRARAMSVMTLVAPNAMPSVKEDESQSETSNEKDAEYVAEPEETGADPEKGETYADLDVEPDDGVCCAHCRFAREPRALGKAPENTLFETGNVFEKDFQQRIGDAEPSNALFFDRGNVFAGDYEKRFSDGKPSGDFERDFEKISPFDDVQGKPEAEPAPEKELVKEPVSERPAPAKAPEKPARKPFREGDTGYLDGLRGLVMIMVFTQHFADNTWLVSSPRALDARTR